MNIRAKLSLFFKQHWFSIALAIGILWLPVPVPEISPIDRYIRIEASTYQFTPEEIQVNPGDRITIEFTSSDVVHGLSIEGYSLELIGEAGRTVRATFIADRPGVFRIRCTVPCGNLHPFMLGKLRVGPNIFLIRSTALGLLVIVIAMKSHPTFSKQPQNTVLWPG